MILHIENLEALDRLRARFARLVNPDATPLMITWMDIIGKDNQRGVLAGLDKDGKPLWPVTYRPKGDPLKTTSEQRLGQKASQRGVFGGFGPMASGLHNNLTSGGYRRLGGPRWPQEGSSAGSSPTCKSQKETPVLSSGVLRRLSSRGVQVRH